jgi:uncharacterized protein YjiS (DUF1127 family)
MTMPSSARSLRPAQVRSTHRTVWQSTCAAIRGLIAAINRERKIRRSLNELSSWPDYMLRDIGLTRSDVERAVRFGRN